MVLIYGWNVIYGWRSCRKQKRVSSGFSRVDFLKDWLRSRYCFQRSIVVVVQCMIFSRRVTQRPIKMAHDRYFTNIPCVFVTPRSTASIT